MVNYRNLDTSQEMFESGIPEGKTFPLWTAKGDIRRDSVFDRLSVSHKNMWDPS